MDLKINNQYILLEKNNDYVFKALINDVTKTSIQITNLDNGTGPVRTLLTAFHEKLDIIELIDDKQIETQIAKSIDKLKELYDNPINKLEIESAMMTSFLENQKTLEPDFQDTLNDVTKETGKDKPTNRFVNQQETDNIIPDEPDFIEITKPLTNNWCIQVTEENKELIETWLGFPIKSKNIGCYYGINQFGQKVFNYQSEGWSDTFSELITTEQFTKYIFNITDEVESDNDNLYVNEFKGYKEETDSLSRTKKNKVKEVWKKVKEVSGHYEYSSLGKLRKSSTGSLIKKYTKDTYRVIINGEIFRLRINELNNTYFGN